MTVITRQLLSVALWLAAAIALVLLAGAGFFRPARASASA